MSVNKIEGVPEGWEVVRIGVANFGETYIDEKGWRRVCNCEPSTESNAGSAIVRRIEPPKPTYIPWTFETCPIGRHVVCLAARQKGIITGASDDGVRIGAMVYSYDQLLTNWQSDNGTPKGTPCGTLKVQE